MTTANPVPAVTPNEAPARLPRRGRMILIVLFVVAAAGMAAFASSAFSQGFGHGFGPPWHARWGQTFDPAAIEDRTDRMVRHLSIEVDATAEQQERLRGIMRSAVRDILPLREKAVTSRQRGRELLTQTTIDRAAIETLRTEQMALADQATRRVSQALADAATVLSPEQRRKIADRIDRWRSFGHSWHRG